MGISRRQVANRQARIKTRGPGSLLYLRAVTLHISGHSNQEIGATLGVSPGAVGDMLNSPEGHALIGEAKRRIRENIFGQMEADLIDLTKLSIDNIRETVEARFTPGSRGKVHQDNIGMKLLGVLGYTDGSMGEQRRREGSGLSEELAGKLLAAIERANENQEEEPLLLGEAAYIEDAEIVGEDAPPSN